ncbi:SapC family protein [Roseateles sp. DAIF2]|uniref:SapC family protein n=1 Tax=Roseateles sp. DAIF2 TaxID=2714952 RepID=UPI0018A2D5D8|nr:SapC family protein [Roseateles sp. DAIF2]QPF74995.1 SapC family protein [Roseateles sp. DAIF2]
MSNPPMYGSLVPLDREQHKNLRLQSELPTLERAAELNSVFLAAVEFNEACKEFPIVFVRVGDAPKDGAAPAVAPLAVFGLKPGSNLFIKDGKWTGNYTPAYLRRYPFAMARIDSGDQIAVCFDEQWKGFSQTEGTALFGADGQPSEFTTNAQAFLENFEREAERTRLVCEELQKLELLQDMRFEATLPNGEKIDVDGFLAINEEKLSQLPDAKVLELFRNGVSSLIEMHRVSMGNMSRLAQGHSAAAAPAAA